MLPTLRKDLERTFDFHLIKHYYTSSLIKSQAIFLFENNQRQQDAIEEETNRIRYDIQRIFLNDCSKQKQHQTRPNKDHHTYWRNPIRVSRNHP